MELERWLYLKTEDTQHIITQILAGLEIKDSEIEDLQNIRKYPFDEMHRCSGQCRVFCVILFSKIGYASKYNPSFAKDTLC